MNNVDADIFNCIVSYCILIAFIMSHEVNTVDTDVRMVYLSGHPAKYESPSIVYCANV